MPYIIRNFINHKFLLRELVLKGIKLKYRKSYLGILWSLVEPILMTIVLTIIFGTLFGNPDKTYPLYILCGRLLFAFFSNATNTSLRAIRSNASMIKKVYVPKYLYVLSSMLSNYIIFLISLIVLVGFSVVLQVYPTIHILMIWMPLTLMFLLSFGIGMILSTVGVFFRDMEYIWGIFTTIIMYSSAIFYYPEKILNSDYDWVLMYNPLYHIITMFRNCIYGEMMNSFSLIYSVLFTIGAVLFGCVIFLKKQDKFILHI